jgi:formylglycine-generating enzyme required for sulfatase activity
MSKNAITQTNKMEWVTIPAGEFIMGSGKSQIRRVKQLDPEYSDEWLEREQPQRKVYLSEYTIAKYPVTNRQFKAFVKDTDYRTERELDGLGKSIWYKLREAPLEERLDHPVTCVTRKDALAYCAWFSEKTGVKICLPTEAQWEKAARGTDGRLWPWGDEFDETKCNIAGNGTTAVGSYPDGASPYGLMDCAGNVWEWCHDWFATDAYHHTPTCDPQGPDSGEYYVVRGGSWYRGRRSAGSVRTTARFRHYIACYTFGFRVARSRNDLQTHTH